MRSKHSNSLLPKLLLPLLLVGALFALWTWGSKGRTREGTASPTEARTSSGRDDAPLRSAELEFGERTTPSGAMGSAEGSGTSSVRIESALFRPDGSQLEPEECQDLRWKVRVESPGVGRKVATWVQDSVPAVAGGTLVVLEGRLGNFVVTPRAERHALGGEPAVTLVGDLPPMGEFRALDRTSGEDLEELWVVSTMGTEGWNLAPPLALRPSAQVVAGPSFSLPANLRHVAYWLGAEGHAWSRVTFGQASGGPVHTLGPGGDLRLSVRLPEGSGGTYFVRVQRPGGDVLVEEPLDGRSLTVDGLPPGSTRLLFLVRQRQRLQTIHFVDVEIDAGETLETSVDLADRWRPEQLGSVFVELLAEDDRDARSLDLSIQSLEEEGERWSEWTRVSTLPREFPRGYEWRTGLLAPGRYVVRVHPGELEREVVVQAGLRTEVVLDVPTLVKLRLWPSDAVDGEQVRPDLVSWRRKGAKAWNRGTPTPFDGGWVLSVERGELEVAVTARGYRRARFLVDVDGPFVEHVFELERMETRNLVVQLRHEGRPVPAPPTTWSSTSLLDEEGESAYLRIRPTFSVSEEGLPPDGASAIFEVEEVGRYRLELGEVPGFVRPEPRFVALSGDRKVVTFDLELAVGVETR